MTRERVSAAAGLALLFLAGLACRSRAMSTATADAASEAMSKLQTPAEKLARDYMTAPTCDAKAAFVLHPKTTKPVMDGCIADIVESVDSSECDALSKDGGCVVTGTTAGASPFTLLLQRSGGALQVDYRGSVLGEPMSMAAFKAKMPSEQFYIFRVKATLSNYFNYDFGDMQATHYSAEIHLPGDKSYRDRLHGYVKKETKDGERLFTALADGKEHKLVVALVYPNSKRSPDIVRIYRVYGEGWFETDAEAADYAPSPK